MPRVAKLLPIPRRFDKIGVQRYGFHGCHMLISSKNSYAWPVKGWKRTRDLAHLGNGASIAAVSNGKSVDTSMGFTPAGGMVMGTRPGDLIRVSHGT